MLGEGSAGLWGLPGPGEGDPRIFAVMHITGPRPSPRHDAPVETTPDRSTAMFTRWNLARIARSPEMVLTICFAGILFAYLSAASFSA